MKKAITITGRAIALVSKHNRFDPANPENTKAHDFTLLGEEHMKGGVLDAYWLKEGYRHVGFAEIKIEMLPIDDMMNGAVEALRAQKQYIIAEAQAEATRIEGEIQKLLAITFDAAA